MTLPAAREKRANKGKMGVNRMVDLRGESHPRIPFIPSHPITVAVYEPEEKSKHSMRMCTVAMEIQISQCYVGDGRCVGLG